MQLGFEVPRNFHHVESYRPISVDEEIFRNVPDIITAAIVDTIDLPGLFDPTLPFIYLRHGLLPEFPVVYFMNAQPRSRISNSTRFYRALHLIDLYRQYLVGAHVAPEEEEEAGVAGEGEEAGGDPGDEPVAGGSGLNKS
jgi:hypothetical protein